MIKVCSMNFWEGPLADLYNYLQKLTDAVMKQVNIFFIFKTKADNIYAWTLKPSGINLVEALALTCVEQRIITPSSVKSCNPVQHLRLVI